MQGSGTMVRQEKFEKVRAFNAYPAEVGQAKPMALAFDLFDPPHEAFDADKICIWILAGVFRKKGSVATTEFDFERLRFGEELGRIQSLQN